MNQGFAILLILRYYLYRFISFKVPSLLKIRLPNHKKPDDIKYSRGPGIREHPLGTTDDTHLILILEALYTINTEKDNPVLYEPPLSEILGEGLTSCIIRVAPSVVIKCPRFSW